VFPRQSLPGKLLQAAQPAGVPLALAMLVFLALLPVAASLDLIGDDILLLRRFRTGEYTAFDDFLGYGWGGLWRPTTYLIYRFAHATWGLLPLYAVAGLSMHGIAMAVWIRFATDSDRGMGIPLRFAAVACLVPLSSYAISEGALYLWCAGDKLLFICIAFGLLLPLSWWKEGLWTLLCLAAKDSGFIYPAIAWLHRVLVLKRGPVASLGELWLAILVAGFRLFLLAQMGSGSASPSHTWITCLESVAASGAAMWLPDQVQVIYNWSHTVREGSPASLVVTIWGVALFVILQLGVWMEGRAAGDDRASRRALFALLAAVLCLVIYLPTMHNPVSRYLYVPLFFAALMVAKASERLTAAWPQGRGRQAVGAALAAAVCFYTVQSVRLYYSHESIRYARQEFAAVREQSFDLRRALRDQHLPVASMLIIHGSPFRSAPPSIAGAYYQHWIDTLMPGSYGVILADELPHWAHTRHPVPHYDAVYHAAKRQWYFKLRPRP